MLREWSDRLDRDNGEDPRTPRWLDILIGVLATAFLALLILPVLF